MKNVIEIQGERIYKSTIERYRAKDNCELVIFFKDKDSRIEGLGHIIFFFRTERERDQALLSIDTKIHETEKTTSYGMIREKKRKVPDGFYYDKKPSFLKNWSSMFLAFGVVGFFFLVFWLISK